MDMRRRLEELQQKWQAEGKPALDAGIGINSGKCWLAISAPKARKWTTL
jgi:class 3 adenylate cyclase